MVIFAPGGEQVILRVAAGDGWRGSSGASTSSRRGESMA